LISTALGSGFRRLQSSIKDSDKLIATGDNKDRIAAFLAHCLYSASFQPIMVAPSNLDVGLTGAGLAVVALATTPALVTAVTQLRKRTAKDNFYEDIDGKSTPESIAAFSNRLPKIFILALSAIGLGTSIAISVLSSLNPHTDALLLKNWLITGTWVSSIRS
jgi:hypothetical protein